MEEQKNSKKLIILVCLLSILVLALGGFILYDKVFSNQEQKPTEKPNIIDNNNSNNQIVETPINNIVIKNSEIKELYSYLQPSLNSNNVCLGYFYQNPYKNHTLADKVSLVLINYAEKYKKKIDDTFLEKIPQSDRELVKNSKEYYIESSVVKEGLKLIFNIDIDKFDDNANYSWDYRSDVDAFVEIDGGGNYDVQIVQKIIDYNELNDEINLTVVKAEIMLYPKTIIENGETTIPAGAL